MTGSHSPKSSLIVAVYEHADFLEKLFVSFQNQTFKDFEIIVADDGSGPSVSAMIAKYQKYLAQPIQHVRHEHIGFRKTIIINHAVREARSDYLIFIDGDCILHHRFIEFHMKRRKKGTVLSGRRVMMNEELSNTVTLESIRTRTIQKLSFWWGKCNRSGYRHGFFLPGIFFLRNLKSRKRFDILGCNFSVNKADFLYVNGYDERIIGRGLEDNNLSARFNMAGIKIKTIAHEALQYHLYHRSDPIPHSPEVMAQFKYNLSSFSTPYGIEKSEEDMEK
jgi:glycosyltransferase involved in cell wall biosynthesis